MFTWEYILFEDLKVGDVIIRDGQRWKVDVISKEHARIKHSLFGCAYIRPKDGAIVRDKQSSGG